jgi:hypothetical protein
MNRKMTSIASSSKRLPRSVRSRAILIFAVLGLLLAGCKSKPGDKCEVGPARCVNKASALTCQGGVLAEVSCRGPAGCTSTGQTIACDDSVSLEGEACLASGSDSANRACTSDKKESLVCESGTWKPAQRCTGPKGCGIRGDVVACDVRGEAVGDPCPKPGTFSCSTDSKSRLACKDGKFVFDRFCRGQAGCRDSDVSCDESTSNLGDPCGVPGMVACGADGSNELVCQRGQFVVQRECSKRGCRVAENRRIDCE